MYQIINQREMGENSNNGKRDNEALLMLQAQAEVRNYMFIRFADCMALKSAVELGIADIIHRHGGPISLSQIVASLSDAPSPDITCLERIMRLLVHRKIFSAASDGGEMLYDLTYFSRWLLRDMEKSLVPKILFDGHPVIMAPLHYLSHCVREGGTTAFKKAHGCEVWEYGAANPEFNKLFNNAMQDVAKISIPAIVAGYKHGFDTIGSLVDVGGSFGQTVSEIVKSYPHIKCINFDLPHVIATAPQYKGVTHVGGDMFHSTIPPADAVFMKCILHNWSDNDCIKILQNCKKAIPEKTGKVILAEMILKEEGNRMFDENVLYHDLFMVLPGGRERNELQWKNLLQQAGFPRYNIVTLPTFLSIIQAYPL